MAEVKVCNFLMAQDGSQRQTLSAALPFAARDATGHIKPHSFLGSLDDMTAAANLPAANKEKQQQPRAAPELPAARPLQEAMRRASLAAAAEARNARDARALAHWERQTARWRFQAEHIAERTGIEPEMQNMQTYELHRRKRELQEALERAIPRREGGHGLLAGDGIEFWQAMPRSRTDLSLSLSNPRRSRKSGVLFVGRPLAMYNEMSLGRARHSRPSWFSATPYAGKRLEDLDDELQEQLVFEPDTAHLFVEGAQIHPQTPPDSDDESEGSSNMAEFERLEKEIEEELAGMRGPSTEAQPSMRAAAGPRLALRVEGERNAHAGEACRVLFNTVVQERKHSVLLLENTGTTVMYYRWQQIERDNALGRLADDRQRFFLDFEPGVVLPGECRELTISYLSPNPGVFSESWQLLVQPWAEKEVPQLSLCGVTDRVDVNKTLREAIEARLERRHMENAMRSLVYDMVAALRPTGPKMPASRWAPARVRFATDNAKALTAVDYSDDIFQALEDLYRRAAVTVSTGVVADKPSTAPGKGKRGKTQEVETAVDVAPWDGSLETLREAIMAVEDNAERETMLEEMMRLSSSFSPVHEEAVHVLQDGRIPLAREAFVRMINRFEDEAGNLRTAYRLPPMALVVKRDEGRKVPPAVPASGTKKREVVDPKVAKRVGSSRPKSSSSQSQTQETEEEIVEPVSDRDRAEYHTRVTVAVRQIVSETINALAGMFAELPDRPSIV